MSQHRQAVFYSGERFFNGQAHPGMLHDEAAAHHPVRALRLPTKSEARSSAQRALKDMCVLA